MVILQNNMCSSPFSIPPCDGIRFPRALLHAKLFSRTIVLAMNLRRLAKDWHKPCPFFSTFASTQKRTLQFHKMNMKTTSGALYLFAFGWSMLTLLLLSPSHVGARSATPVQYAAFVTFDGANAVAFCTAAETTLIATEIDRAFAASSNGNGGGNGGVRRQLRRRSLKRRSLQLIKYMPLMAWATAKCGGAVQRRRLKGDDDDSCARDTAHFDAALTAVESQVSAPCRAYTKARTFTCRPVLDCNIASITYHWNDDDQQVGQLAMDTKNPNAATKICQGQRIDFEAGTAFDVGHVQFNLTSADGGGYHYTSQDDEAPYFLFGNGTRPDGQELSEGSYTFMAVTAASGADGAVIQPTSFQFRVRSCS